ncbi:MAG: type II toxin-antitoxin system Phd/YefM family antitoxin [Rhodospirillaceae bacterium]|nr:type II toxin-antitoxin system Phd/YefM family antitoxin [Rhodospirillaceae bacterium]
MKTVNTHYAKTHLSRLLAEASAGEEIFIAKSGAPIAKLVPLSAAEKRGLGLANRMGLTIDMTHFFDPLPEEELRLWEGEGSDFDLTP